jgi:hypothetical protein
MRGSGQKTVGSPGPQSLSAGLPGAIDALFVTYLLCWIVERRLAEADGGCRAPWLAEWRTTPDFEAPVPACGLGESQIIMSGGTFIVADEKEGLRGEYLFTQISPAHAAPCPTAVRSNSQNLTPCATHRNITTTPSS